ncbi:MAG: DNA polymerase III subunit gamma/tau [Ruminococcus sp.]|jgi:DNA polymerase-3 subunit gamma/tau|nr:DNA polymerase III subunit gamma/tau [Ruminococcus sp.]
MYVALYRKYRPAIFDDVVAQNHITETLKNQIAAGKTAHAYLFTGSRGTGKTTCARIFAKAVNCLHPKNGNPCLECEICREAENGTLPDITEIDAASNNGVNDVRELRDFAVYSPEQCRYKVYIIDEVHMLTKDAFNALLKIMEEPPEHVKFILATTEIHKVLPTIISRCQRFDFRRVDTDGIEKRLQYVSEQENITLTAAAASLIAKTSDGGMRDALSLLDTCTAYSSDVTLDIVSSAAGIAGRESLYELIDAITAKDTAKAIGITDELYRMSKDLTKLCDELIEQYRNIMLLKALPNNTENIICLPDEMTKLKAVAEKMTMDSILSDISLMRECADKLLRASNKRAEFEFLLISLCSAIKTETPLNTEITDKIKMLERRITDLSSAPQTHPQPNPAPPPQYAVNPLPPQTKTDLSKININDFAEMHEWAEVLERFTQVLPGVAGTLKNSNAKYYENILLIYSRNEFFLDLLKKPENSTKLRETIAEVTGKFFTIRAKVVKTDEGIIKNSGEELISKALMNNIPVEKIN